MLILEGQDGSRTNCATNKNRVSRDFEQRVTCGALKLVLEKYRFSKSNQRGVLPSFTAISHRPLGSALALDYEFNSPCTRMLTIRLHQPADVTELSKNMKDSRDLYFSKDVAFMTERGGSVSHLKHETFGSLQYATDFGTIFIRNP